MTVRICSNRATTTLETSVILPTELQHTRVGVGFLRVPHSFRVEKIEVKQVERQKYLTAG